MGGHLHLHPDFSVWKVFHQIHPNWLLSRHHWSYISYLLILMHNKLSPKTKWWLKTFYIMCDYSALRPSGSASLSQGYTQSVGKDCSQLSAWVGKAHSSAIGYSTSSRHWNENLGYLPAVGWGRPLILCPQQLTTWQAAESNKKARRCREWISSML